MREAVDESWLRRELYFCTPGLVPPSAGGHQIALDNTDFTVGYVLQGVSLRGHEFAFVIPDIDDLIPVHNLLRAAWPCNTGLTFGRPVGPSNDTFAECSVQ